MSSIWLHRALNAKQNQSWEFDILNFGFARRQVSGVARQKTTNQNQMVKKTLLTLPTHCIAIRLTQKIQIFMFQSIYVYQK